MSLKESPSAPLCAEAYRSACEALWNDAGIQTARTESLAGFWKRWVAAHERVLNLFGGQFEELKTADWENDSRELMKLRQRMVSAFVQGEKSKDAAQDWQKELGRLLEEHDKIYVGLLCVIREHVGTELKRAVLAKRVLSAYAHTARHMGE